jgi:hypothetical protein
MSRRSGAVRPAWGWFALLDGGLVALAILASSEETHGRATDVSPIPLPPRHICRSLLANAVAIHVVEALVAGRMARRRGLSPRGWRGQTLLVGFPSLLQLRRIPKD